MEARSGSARSGWEKHPDTKEPIDSPGRREEEDKETRTVLANKLLRSCSCAPCDLSVNSCAPCPACHVSSHPSVPALTYMAARTQVDLSCLFIMKAIERLQNGWMSAALPALCSICRPDGEEGRGEGEGEMAPPRGKKTERKAGLRE